MANRKTPHRRYKATRSSADSQRRGLKIRRALISLAILIVIAATIFFLVLRRGDQVSIGENAIGSLLTPVQNAFTSATDAVKDFFTRWRNYDQLQDDYDALLRENQQLSLELDSAEEAVLENERLKTLLDAQSAYESLDPIYAKVIAHDASQWFSTFSINRGDAHGVSVGMAVVNGDGLIGRVYEVGLNYAKVLSIIDPRSKLSCLVQRTRDTGMMHGGVSDTDDNAQCYVYRLPNVNNIVPGDIVVTAGTDSYYPKGIRIGTVTQLSLNAGSEGSYAVVEPSVDFLHIEEVLVLRDVVETDTENALPAVITPTPAPTSTPDPAAVETATPQPTEDIFYYPSPSANVGSGSSSPLEKLPEDEWAAD